ncbi:MAG: ArsA family ATPase, partial [Myxococcota bacterium]|nr:ArsA family ATPase [Myxococcota bacterium]
AELEREDRGRPLIAGALPRPSKQRARAASKERAVGFVAPAGLRVVMFGGKGGVGKTTCAAAAAISIAERHPDRRVLLLSTDPAHSLGDALELEVTDAPLAVPGVRGQLEARELDASAELARRREQYARAVDRLFDALRGGSRLEATYDRAIVHDLIELAPPGIDEIVATVALLDAFDPGALPAGLVGASASPPYDHVIVDTAPWGHTERWLQLPAHAREWVRSLLAVLLEYRRVIGLGDLAEDLVALSRGLGRLVESWRDPGRTAFVPVTRAAALPRLETMRMRRSLQQLGIDVPSIIVDAVHDDVRLCDRCDTAREIELREIAALRAELGPSAPKLVRAPLRAAPPRGVAALRGWASTWEVMWS